ncbi:hypothetical protein [Actinomadura sp. 9N215]|uniref:hypothetical protein n=1 Tax=Actinomadura sp. 9N215 TaxID=3375150 RepID=UPI003787A9B4
MEDMAGTLSPTGRHEEAVASPDMAARRPGRPPGVPLPEAERGGVDRIEGRLRRGRRR